VRWRSRLRRKEPNDLLVLIAEPLSIGFLGEVNVSERDPTQHDRASQK
jgi:type VI protein secretion system component VasF